MTYTQEEQQLIEYAARKLYPIILEDDWDKNKQYREEFESAFHSIAMQKILDKRIIAALEEYDVRTEKYLNEEFGVNYFSSELQNMDSDFSFYNQVLTAIDNY